MAGSPGYKDITRTGIEYKLLKLTRDHMSIAEVHKLPIDSDIKTISISAIRSDLEGKGCQVENLDGSRKVLEERLQGKRGEKRKKK